jgi:transposase
MIQLAVTAEEVQSFRQLALEHPHSSVRKKILVLLLHSGKIPTKHISTLLDVSENTTRNYLREYQTGGLQKTTEVRFRQPQSRLKPFDEQIKHLIDEHPCSTVKHVCAVVHEKLGVQLKPSAMRAQLKKLGAKHRKVGGIPQRQTFKHKNNSRKKKWSRDLKRLRLGSERYTSLMLRTLYLVRFLHAFGVLCVDLSELLPGENALMS